MIEGSQQVRASTHPAQLDEGETGSTGRDAEEDPLTHQRGQGCDCSQVVPEGTFHIDEGPGVAHRLITWRIAGRRNGVAGLCLVPNST